MHSLLGVEKFSIRLNLGCIEFSSNFVLVPLDVACILASVLVSYVGGSSSQKL